MLSPAFVQIRDALAQAPFVARIETQDDYERALELMDQLVEDYDDNKPLIEVLAVSIERWEDQAAESARAGVKGQCEQNSQWCRRETADS